MDAEKTTMDFTHAYDTYADSLFRHCYFRISDRERAKELTQETFTKAWDSIAKGTIVDNMKAFLYRIANNLIVDEYKKRKTVSLEDMVEAGFSPEADAVNLNNILDGKALSNCLSKVEEPYRTALIMRYIDDLTPHEIALSIGKTANVVSVHINRGLKKLRQLFPTL